MESTHRRIKCSEDEVAKVTFFLCAGISILVLFCIVLYLFCNGIPFVARYGFTAFLFGMKWDIASSDPKYGILAMSLTTLILTAIATLIGGLLGVFSAIALFKFVPKKIAGVCNYLIQLLAGIPSVVFGLFGMTFIVPFVRDYISSNGVGYGILSSSIVLGVMILPTVTSMSLNALNAVDKSYFEGSLALGMNKTQSVFQTVLPSAKNGIFAGIILGLGRALGETMAVMMVIGGSAVMPTSLTKSVRTLTANIAMGANELTGEPLEALIACGCVLFVFTLLVYLALGLLKRKGKEK